MAISTVMQPSGTLTAGGTNRTDHVKCSNTPKVMAPRYIKGGRINPILAASGTMFVEALLL
ncbi:hypothetical protein [Dulcicalothrix desertica]|uniref:hypothetical protein n=1 Tax=Dulcicalothrix desertica TaxID=32056 RepID=UPI001F2DCCDA|nr:hypothetical protein [Dulcicalothrix desertica]